MEFIETCPDEEYKIILTDEDINTIKKSIQKIIDKNKDVNCDILHVTTMIYGEPHLFKQNKLHFSHYTFKVIKMLLNL